ncbi:MAG TPA: sugar porter family MFS transporter [Stackebrandtia sp.]|jgi:sugar porter (SP) family MFS transporter|uniref:sugar porter family MFS transporter n=1 Tax=Stackebrandtia sp. TaxID=2023065 RepID=UPI002D4F3677|nr:sugar porter family MFS transporter [Stackebrandtia sp.]HZE40875.1 sugar porter family MFS transporter [Stackebrandtia sp.]
MDDSVRGTGTVLAALDRRPPTSLYWSLTLLATLGGFLFGFDTANIGSALPFLPYHLGPFWAGYLVAGASLGAAAGALLAGPLTDRFGRKSLLIVDAGLYAAGALLSAFTWDAWVLIVARTIIGLAIGADSAIATAYIAEYAPSGRRGQLSMLQQWMITVGILVAYVVAMVVLMFMPHHAYGLDWRLIFGVGAVPAILGLLLRTRMPESPRWLMLRGRYEQARRAIGKLGITATVEEIQRDAIALERGEAEGRRAQKRSWTPGVKKALMVVCVFFIFQQITGINVPLYYGPTLLTPLLQGSDATLVQSQIASVQVTAIMTLVNVAATYFGFRYIDKLGRRPLAIGGFAGMAVFALVAAAGLAFFSGIATIIVVMLGLCLFIASFAVGVGGTGWVIQGETFPTEVRGRAAAISATVNWVSNFALIQIFPMAKAGIGLGWVLASFAALCVCAIVFVKRSLPETKGIPVDDIIHIYERRTASAA